MHIPRSWDLLRFELLPQFVYSTLHIFCSSTQPLLSMLRLYPKILLFMRGFVHSMLIHDALESTTSDSLCTATMP